MKRRITLSIFGAVAVLGLAALAVVAWMVMQPGPTGFAGGHRVDLARYTGANPTGVPSDLAAQNAQIRGAYVMRMADCEACHTAKGGKPFAGGRPFKLPFGTIYTPNITPDVATGIGQWSDADFLRAVHKGIGKGGKWLYPAFPYASYTMLSDADVLAIKAYLFALKPVHNVVPSNTLRFPYNQRWLMAIWATLFDSDTRFRPIPERSARWNRGAYLVEAAGHCGECHSPRNLMQALDQRHKFGGGAAEGWTAYNISGDRPTGVGAWTAADLQSYLAKGHAAGLGTASGPMAEVVGLSTSKLEPADIAAIVDYLQTVPATRSSNLPDAMKGPATSAPKLGSVDNPLGKKIFEGACVSCHAWTGAGAMRNEAQLTGNRAVNDDSATNVAQMILNGGGKQNDGNPYMPSFAQAYSNREIAAVANYVTARFGSTPSRITDESVAKLRAQN